MWKRGWLLASVLVVIGPAQRSVQAESVRRTEDGQHFTERLLAERGVTRPIDDGRAVT